MYETNEYVTAELGLRRGPTRRTWLTLIPTVAAALVLLFLLGAACKARSDQPETPLGAIGTPSTSAEPTPGAKPSESSAPGSGGGADTDGAGGGDAAAGGGNAGPGGGAGPGPGGGGNPGPDPEPEPPVEPEPVEPLSIQATIDTVTPGGQCFASGTITVSGGEYPVTVHYQWRRVALVNGQLGTEAVTPVQNVTFDAAGARTAQTSSLPTDGPNVRIFVTGPLQVNSAWVAYESCGGQPGDFIHP